jgi:hypothetical protein
MSLDGRYNSKSKEATMDNNWNKNKRTTKIENNGSNYKIIQS